MALFTDDIIAADLPPAGTPVHGKHQWYSQTFDGTAWAVWEKDELHHIHLVRAHWPGGDLDTPDRPHLGRTDCWALPNQLFDQMRADRSLILDPRISTHAYHPVPLPTGHMVMARADDEDKPAK